MRRPISKQTEIALLRKINDVVHEREIIDLFGQHPPNKQEKRNRLASITAFAKNTLDHRNKQGKTQQTALFTDKPDFTHAIN